MPSISPVVLMDGRTIVACGARAASPDGQIAVEVRLTRTAGGAELVLSGALDGVEAEVAADTVSITSSELFSGRAGPTLRTSAADARVTTFIQELMVSGARVRIETENKPAIEADIIGPMPQSTRAAYLNCAGDLYRPDE